MHVYTVSLRIKSQQSIYARHEWKCLIFAQFTKNDRHKKALNQSKPVLVEI